MESLPIILLNTIPLKNIELRGLMYFCYTTMSKFWQGVSKAKELLLKLIFLLLEN